MKDMLPKVSEIRNEADKVNPQLLIEVDGGIAENTIAKASKAGVDSCVAGTAVFKAEDSAQAIANLKRIADENKN